MVYKRYIKRNGKLVGPYYYESYRRNGKIVSKYIGTELPERKETGITLQKISLILIVLFGLFILYLGYTTLFGVTGKVVLHIDEDYIINNTLKGNVSLVIGENEVLSKDLEVSLVLSRENEIILDSSKTLEEFLGTQITYEEINSTTEICENNTIGEQCTNSSSSGYYYTTAGTYSVAIAELIDYEFVEAGSYKFTVSIPALGLSTEKIIEVAASAENITENAPAVNNESALTNETAASGETNGSFIMREIMAVPSVAQVFVNSSTAMNLTDEILTCWARGTDGDGDNVSYNGTWYKDGAVNFSYNSYPNNYTQNTLINVSSVNPSLTSVGENWSCSSSAFDGSSYSSSVASNNLTILAVPAVSDVILNSTFGTNYTNENLTVYYNLSFADRAIINWYRNNTPMASLNLPFEGGSNSTWTREYVFGTNATVNRSAWNSTGGYNGNGAYEFNGTGGGIFVKNHFAENTSYTIAAWIKPMGTGTLLHRGTSNGCFYNPRISFDSSEVLKFTESGCGSSGVRGSFNISNGNWTHIAAVRNGTTTKFYINGVLNATNTTAPPSPAYTTNGKIFVGAIWADTTGIQGFFNGTVDEVLVYDYELSAAQIANIFNNRTDKITFNETAANMIVRAEVTPNDGLMDGTKVLSNNLTIALLPGTYPNVTLISPANGTSLVNPRVEYRCNATSVYDLVNMTLFVYGPSGSLLYNNTRNVTGTYNESSWNLTSYTIGQYNWTCRAINNQRYNYTAPNSSFTLVEGVYFVNYSYYFNATRAFNGLKLGIRNSVNNVSANITANVTWASGSFPSGPTGAGTLETPLEILFNETLNITIGMFLAEENELSYALNVSLYNSTGETDRAQVFISLPSLSAYNLEVLPNQLNLTITDISNNSQICSDSSISFNISNTMNTTLSDLRITNISGSLPVSIFPKFDRFRLPAYTNVTVDITSVVNETTPTSFVVLNVSAAGIGRLVTINYTAPGGSWTAPTFLGTGITWLSASSTSFLCINKPSYIVNLNFDDRFVKSSIISAIHESQFSDACHSVQPHNTYFTLNGNQFYSILNDVPFGKITNNVNTSFVEKTNTLIVSSDGYAGGFGGGHYCAYVGDTLKVEVAGAIASYCPFCNKTENSETNFTDGINSDCDGGIDCEDTDSCGSDICNTSVLNQLICPIEEYGADLCSDGVDNDQNGLTDCQDIFACCGFDVCRGDQYCRNVDTFCDEGDLETNCYVRTTKNINNITKFNIDGNRFVVRGNNVFIEDFGIVKSSGNNTVLNFTHLTIRSGGKIRPGSYSTINISAETLVIDSDSAIDLTSGGYSGGADNQNGTGPGAGIARLVPGLDILAGGAGHGGYGGAQLAHGIKVEGGGVYGSALVPMTAGSGGAGGGIFSSSGRPGGSGGGIIILKVNGTLTVDGNISADGGAGMNQSSVSGFGNNVASAGGSGGSIYIIATNINGSGLISARGGKGGTDSGCCSEDGGAGAGGRIAIYYNYSNFTGQINVSGGWSRLANQMGMPGTAALIDRTRNVLTLNNDFRFQGNDIALTNNFSAINLINARARLNESGLVISPRNLTLINSSINSVAGSQISNSIELVNSSVNISVVKLEIDANSSISLKASGGIGGNATAPNGTGLGAGIYPLDISCDAGGNGAGHGGYGGRANRGVNLRGGIVYDSAFSGFRYGSGGSASGDKTGGRGGGAIFVNATTFILNGSLIVDAESGTTKTDGTCGGGSGGGSGGSIYLSVYNLSGSGNLTAIGAAGGDDTASNREGGGGSGGRIAIYYNYSTFSGVANVSGGFGPAGAIDGMPGTAVFVDNVNNIATTKDDFRWQTADSNTLMSFALVNITNTYTRIDEYAMSINARVLLIKNSTISTISNYGFSGSDRLANVTLNISADNLTLDSSSLIDLRYSGGIGGNATAQNGSGAGGGIYFLICDGGGNGAGAGGFGGRTNAGLYLSGGKAYSSLLAPLASGSGGSGTIDQSGGAGGGAIFINATNLVLNGTIDATAFNGTTTTSGGCAGGGGGGSGGSIYLSVYNLSGSGNLTAIGAAGGDDTVAGREGGGGSGGRIAIYYNYSTFNGQMNVTGGFGPSGATDGMSGTILLVNNRIYTFNASVVTGNDNIEDAYTVVVNDQDIIVNATAYVLNATYLNFTRTAWRNSSSSASFKLIYNNSINDLYSNYTKLYLVLEKSRIGAIAWLVNVTGTNLSTNTNISNNRIFVNSTSSSGLNKSANITLRGLSFVQPVMEVSKTDNGIFTSCTDSTTPRCANISYGGGVFLFNVSSFTTYQAAESGDITPPNISIIYPLNTTYNYNITDLNYTVSDNIALSSCWYSIDGGQTNVTIACGTNATGLSSAEGSNSWTVWANDSAGNVNYSSVTFFKDTIAPYIAFGNGTEISNTLLARANIIVNVSSANFINITIRLFNSTGSVNITNSSISPFFLNLTNLPDGIYYFNATAYDSAGNSNSTETRNVTLDTLGPNFVFNYQLPADISSLNAYSYGVNISYNITNSFAGVNESTVRIYYKTNSTLSDITSHINGTSSIGFFNTTGANSSISWLFNLDDNEVYPGDFNLDPDLMEDSVHSNISLTTSRAAKMQFMNVSNETQYNVFEFMANSSIGASSLFIFYCNSSYTSGDVVTNANCSQFGSLPSTQTFNVTNRALNSSSYQIATMTINTTGGMVGTVKVTPISYFVLRNGGIGIWNVYNVAAASRIGAAQTSINNGLNWTNQTFTFDEHLHQYAGNDTFRYYACARDNLGNANCSEQRIDLLDLGGLPPSAPHVYAPITGFYSGNININYTAALSPNNYPIIFYNISLTNLTEGFNKTIITNNSANLGYIWNSLGTNDGTYLVKVVAADNQSLTSFDFSENFTIDNTIPLIQFANPSENSSSVYRRDNIAINVTASDLNFANLTVKLYNSTSLVNSTTSLTSPNYINYTSLAEGIYFFNATVSDLAGNSNSTETRNVTISFIHPQVIILAPTSTTYTSADITINITLNDTGYCEYSFNNGLTNFTLTANASNTGFDGTASLSNGAYTLRAYCNNSFGVANRTETVSFSVSVQGGGGGGGGGGCTPVYTCGEWSNCSDGEQTRTCVDNTCYTADKIEDRSCELPLPCAPSWSCTEWEACEGGKKRRICGDLNSCGLDVERPAESMDCGCQSNYVCRDFGACVYEESLSELIEGTLNLFGKQKRVCEDINHCGSNYNIDSNCTAGFNITIAREDICGEDNLVVSNAVSNKPVTIISLNTLRNNKLDVSFVQSRTQLCSTCYNGVRDGDELGIDCGGSCPSCIIEARSWLGLIILILIIIECLIARYFYKNRDYVRLEYYRDYYIIDDWINRKKADAKMWYKNTKYWIAYKIKTAKKH